MATRRREDDRASLWVLEDDPGVQFVYRELLSDQYDLRIFGSIAEMRSAANVEDDLPPRLMIADLRLSDGSFLDFLRVERHESLSGIPIIVVSSLDDLAITRSCFEYDVADYMTKPFGRAELQVKIERQMRALAARAVTTKVKINEHTFQVSAGPRGSVGLTAREFQIVALLYNAKELTASRKELLRKIWRTTDTSGKTLDVHIYNLRRKLAPIGLQIILRRPYRYSLYYEPPSGEAS